MKYTTPLMAVALTSTLVTTPVFPPPIPKLSPPTGIRKHGKDSRRTTGFLGRLALAKNMSTGWTYRLNLLQ